MLLKEEGVAKGNNQDMEDKLSLSLKRMSNIQRKSLSIYSASN